MTEPILSALVGTYYRASAPVLCPTSIVALFEKICDTCRTPAGHPCLDTCAAALNEFERLHGFLSVYRRPCVVCGCQGPCMPGRLQHRLLEQPGIVSVAIYVEIADGYFDTLGGPNELGGRCRALGAR